MKKHEPYAWGPEHNQTFNNIKKEIVQAPILRYYDLKKETVLQTDASIKGLGACLLQDGHPIYFTCKSLHSAECRYVTIELKALAVTWTMEKFHHFLYASHFTLETDQKPLETILAKSLTEATLQLQQLLIVPSHMILQSDIKDSTNQLAECLSRLGCQKDKIQLPKLKIHAIIRQLPATADRLNQFHTETAHDEELALLEHIVQTGWTQEICDLPKEIQPYWTFHEEMTIEDGLLLKGTSIIIPQTLHKEMIQLLHTGHLRFEKCLNRAKQSMCWPRLYEELKDLVTICTTCLKFSAQKPTCLSNRQYAGHEIPVNPWSKLASDIFYFEGDSYLLIVDYTSFFPIIRKLSSMTIKAIAHNMQAIFAKYGWPNTLVTGNRPYYTSKSSKC